MRCLCLLCCCFWAQASAQEVSKEDILLARVRYHVAQTLQRLPNYTCTQTIERLTRASSSKRIQLIDVVRLEVALVNGVELYKWPGSGAFEERDLRDIVPSGAVGTGQFAGYAQAIFLGHTARYTYAGEESRNGRLLSRWNYVIPQNLSGFKLRVAPHEAIVGFHGSFWIDRETLDLNRLEVYADDIPYRLQLANAITAVEYQRSQIGTGEFLLPSMSEMELVGLQGGSNVNRARFAGCRQYTGQSTVTFDDPAEEKPGAPALRTGEAPAGVTLDVALETPISDKTSAVGDPITVVLKKEAKLGSGLVAPKGALGHGRITFLRKHSANRYSGYLVGLDLTHLEFENTRLDMAAVLEHMAGAAMSRTANPWSSQTYVFREAPSELDVSGSAVFRQGNSLLLDRGTRMYWRTIKKGREFNPGPRINNLRANCYGRGAVVVERMSVSLVPMTSPDTTSSTRRFC